MRHNFKLCFIGKNLENGPNPSNKTAEVRLRVDSKDENIDVTFKSGLYAEACKSHSL